MVKSQQEKYLLPPWRAKREIAVPCNLQAATAGLITSLRVFGVVLPSASVDEG